MGRLLKAELYDMRVALLIPVGVALFTIVVNVVLGWQNPEQDIPGARSVMASMAGILYIMRFTKAIAEKRDRRVALLPVSVTIAGLSRLMFILIYWIVFLILYWLGSSIARPYKANEIIWETLAFTGVILAANAYPYIHRDLPRCYPGKSAAMLMMILYFPVFIIGFLLLNTFAANEQSWEILRKLLPIKYAISGTIQAPIGAFLFILLGTGITLLSVVFYGRREVYLD